MPIYSNTRRSVWLTWLTAILWNALTWTAVIKGYDQVVQVFEAQPLFRFFILFPLLGVLIVFSAIRETLVWRKFGRIALIPSGGDNGVAGYVLIPNGVGKVSPARLSLVCYRRYSYQSSEGNEIRQEAVWQDESTVAPKPSGSGYRVDFRFYPPGNVPATGEHEQDRYHWELRLFMPLPGIDCDMIFELPVSASMLGGTENVEYSGQTATPEKILNAMPTIEVMNDGLRFIYPAGRAKGTAIALMLIAPFIGGFVFLICRNLQHFLAVTVWLILGTTLLLMLLLFLMGVYLAFNCLTIEVDGSGVRREMRIFGYRFTEHVAATDIIDIEMRSNGFSSYGNRTRVYYVLNLVCRNRANLEVGNGIENYGAAHRLRGRMLTALGENRQASLADVPLSDGFQQSPLPNWFSVLSPFGKLLRYAFVIAALYDVGQWLQSSWQLLR